MDENKQQDTANNEAQTPPEEEQAQQPETAVSVEAEAVETAAEGESQEQTATEQSANTEQLQSEIQALQQKLEQETQQRESVTAQAKRLAADFENFRRRSETQKEEIKQNEKRETLSKILEIVDNFERARSQIKPATEGEKNIHKSYQGVYKQLVEAMKSLGVSKMRPEGEPFDPYYHEAMLREPTNEHPEGTVIEELRSGYMLEDTVLRHAMVKVAAAPEPSSQEEASGDTENNSNEEQLA
ncbi:nucleotide exchange factor GrpE [Dactylococcopsis salina]|uniref:Protein GrpE n=2 Tax=Dactylococcopsis salina TaxID=292566 RepID=K9YR89_DACS8|nr:molecular chaperone GrpE (heat shock protein) [Dactylococcopsis salina PCC 8305]